MTRLQLIYREQSSNLAQLRKYLRDQSISNKLSMRVQRNAQHTMEERKRNVPEADVELLNCISTPLKVELHFEVYARQMLEHHFFQCFWHFNAAGMRKLCHRAC